MAQAQGIRKPVVLIVRDGWGHNPNPEHDSFNAVKLARTPVDHRLKREYPNTLIRTSGEDVGLPDGVMGNSEVGHQNIGAGRIVDQEVMRITRAIRDGSFFENKALRSAFDHARRNEANVHIMGLVSDGRVHSDMVHLFALIDLAARLGFPGDRLFIHAITDGRDTAPFSGLDFIGVVEKVLRKSAVGAIASVCGRYYAMDRDHRWERTASAYAMLTGRDISERSVNPHTAQSARDGVAHYYENPTDESRKGDEFIIPTRIMAKKGNVLLPAIDRGDAAIFFNFRGDRPRQLTRAFVLDDEAWSRVKNGGFRRCGRVDDLYFCTMTAYEAGLPVSAVAFPKPPKMKSILGEVVSRAGLTQFRCAETEKFPHVTFFFNDYREEPFAGERRLLCPSPREVSTYDQKPQMSAPEVCDAVVTRLRAHDCEALLVVNFANPDMVGHTGVLAAAVQAVEVVDACVGRIVEATLERNGSLIITADHGNAEQMWHPDSKLPHTAHTTFDVPLILVGEQYRGGELREGGRLADIAPTLLAMMDLPRPAEMTGRSLIIGD